MKLVEYDLKITLKNLFGYIIKYSGNPMARRNGYFQVFETDKKHILNQKGGKF